MKLGISLILLALVPVRALSDDAITARMGADFTHYKNETAIYSAALESFNRSNVGTKFEFGGWTDTGANRCQSPFGSVLVGKRFGYYDGFNLTGFAGIAIIGNTDSALSTNFEFTEEVVAGYNVVGVGYKHISNAGIKTPNNGRDYISLTFAFPF